MIQNIKNPFAEVKTAPIIGQPSEPISAVNSGLSPIQIEVIKLFSKNGFSLSRAKIEEFAKKNSLFVNQFLNSINEEIYEVIDDILIEEQGDCYYLNESYYSKLFDS